MHSVVSRFAPGHILHELLKGDRGKGNEIRGGGKCSEVQVTTQAVVEEVDEFTITADVLPVAAPITTRMVPEEVIEPQPRQKQIIYVQFSQQYAHQWS